MKIETTMKTHWFWTAKIRKIENIQCCHRHGAKRILNNYHWECKMVQMLYKTVQWFLTELNISSLFDPAIIAFDIYPNKLKICVHPKTSTRKFMEALVIISKTWKPLKLSLCRKIVNQKQYCFPGGIAEITTTIKDLKMQGWPFPRHPIQLTWSACAEDGWTLKNNRACCKTNLVGTAVGVAIPGEVSLLEQINTSPAPCMQLLIYLCLCLY